VGLAILLLTASKVGAYAVHAHQAEIDVVWEAHLKALLHKKYPGASEEPVGELVFQRPGALRAERRLRLGAF